MSKNSVGEERAATFIVWEWMLPEKHRKGFRDALYAFELDIVRESSEYWKEQVEAISQKDKAETSEVVRQLCDCIESLLAADGICIHDIDDTEDVVQAKMRDIEEKMHAIIQSSCAGERAKNLARRILSIVYQQSLLHG